MVVLEVFTKESLIMSSGNRACDRIAIALTKTPSGSDSSMITAFYFAKTRPPRGSIQESLENRVSVGFLPSQTLCIRRQSVSECVLESQILARDKRQTFRD